MKVLTFGELQRIKGIPYCRDHLRRKVKAGEFPRPIELSGGHRLAWIEEEVDAYLEALVAKRTADEQREPPAPAAPQKGRRRRSG
jgi:predicted DNA-binding transcriptional regulator AlpA